MKKGWEVKMLGECFRLKSGEMLSSKKMNDGDFPVYGGNGIAGKHNEFNLSGSNVIIGRVGELCGNVRHINESIWLTDNAFQVVDTKYEFDNSFLTYLLNFKNLRNSARQAAQPVISNSSLVDITLEFPTSLSEQKQIVSILDEAFAAIAKAKEVAEKNLQNARAVFETYLEKVFANNEWPQNTLDKIAKNLDNKRIPITQNVRKNGAIPYYGASGIVDYVEDYIFNEDLLLVSEDGANLLMRTYPIAFSVSGKTWVNNHAHVLKFESKVSQKFVEYYLNSIKLDDFISGMAQPKLNQKMLNLIPIPFPDSVNQTELVEKFDSLYNEVQSLESIYQQKLSALEELKKAILQKAFAGELTAVLPEVKVLPVAAKVVPLSPIDLQAGIIALALQRHEAAGNAKTFGHVKAEKIVNTAEYELSLPLKRKPKKDAAGPLDFKRFLQVEALAAKAHIFYVDKTDKGYRYTIGSQATELIQNLKAALGDKYAALIQLIDAMVPLNTKETEVRATVYSAWNNLLLEGAAITPEAIVHEAREDWHPDKLKIDRDKFFEAIDWLEANDMVPTGTGEKVVAKIS